MPTANFQNYDYDTAADEIKHRQAIVDAMRQQAMQGVEVPTAGGGYAVQAKVNPLAALAKVLQGYVASREDKGLADQRRALTDRYSGDLQTGMAQYLQTARGAPGYSLPADQDGPVTQGIPGDPRKAIYDALASNHPQLKAFAMQQLAEQTKNQISAKDLLPYANPTSVPAMVNNGMSGFQPKPDLGVVDKTVYDKNTRETVALGGPKPVLKYIDGNLVEVNPSTGATDMVDKAPKITNTVDMGGKASNKFAEKISEHRAENLSKSFESVKGLPQTLTTLDEASSALSKGIKSGQLGDVSLTLAKVGKSLGIDNASPEIANTEVFRASMANSVLEVLKTLRPASDKDVEYAEKAAGGRITLDDAAMLRLVDSAKVAAAQKLYDHNQLLENNRRGSGAIQEDLDTFNVPFTVHDAEFKNGRFVSTSSNNTTTPKTSTAMSLDEYLKRGK